MQFYYDVDKDNERSLLYSFLKALEEGFRQLIWNNQWGERAIAFYGEGQRYMRGALEEVGGQFHKAQAMVESASPEQFADVGLWGQSLRAKLYYVKFWADLALQGVSGAIGRTLDNINIVLGSFYAATGVGEAIKELKDVIKNNLATV